EAISVLGQQSYLLQRGGLLAVESARRLESLGEPSLEANQALRQTLALLPRRVRAMVLPHGLEQAVFSEGGRFLAADSYAGGFDYTCFVWDLSDGSELARIPHQQGISPGLHDGFPAAGLAVSREGRYLAMVQGKSLHAWDLTSHREVTNLATTG